MNSKLSRPAVLAGLGVIALPLAMGCNSTMEPGAPAFDGIFGPAATNNARTAYFKIDGNTNAKTFDVGATKSNIAMDGGRLDYTVATDNMHDMTGLTGGPSIYNNGSLTGAAVVVPIPDVDGNGQNDQFLMLTTNRTSPTRVERSVAYRGPFTPIAKIEELRANSTKATYTGKGGILGTVGGVEVNNVGDLTMTASFRQGYIEGKIQLPSATAPGGVTYDNMTFSGNITKEFSDFGINQTKIRNGSTIVSSDDSSSGAGSFMGANGQGTIGTFATSSKLGSDYANVLGYFYGSADSLK